MAASDTIRVRGTVDPILPTTNVTVKVVPSRKILEWVIDVAAGHGGSVVEGSVNGIDFKPISMLLSQQL